MLQQHLSLLPRLHLAIRLGQSKFGFRIQLGTKVLPLRGERIRFTIGITARPLVCSQRVGDEDMLLQFAPSLAGARVHPGTPAEDCNRSVSTRV